MRAGLIGTAAGLSLLPHRNRAAGALAGAAYLAAGLCTRFGVYNAGVGPSEDPKYVVVAQRERLARKVH